MSFKLHFLGITAADWHAAHRFYTEQIGMETSELNPDYGNWALMGRHHKVYQETHNVLKFELFDFGSPPLGGWEWGKTQGYRPGIYLDDLEQGMTELGQRGVEFSGVIETTLWGRRIEFKAHEGLCWTLEEAPEILHGNGFKQPNIGSVSLKVSNLAIQKAFYHALLGMQVFHEDDQMIALQRQTGEPYLFLEAGGEKMHVDYTVVDEQIWAHGAWASFSVDDLQSSATSLRSSGVNILQEIKLHEDWAGKDMLISDPDGNIMQLVQYLY